MISSSTNNDVATSTTDKIELKRRQLQAKRWNNVSILTAVLLIVILISNIAWISSSLKFSLLNFRTPKNNISTPSPSSRISLQSNGSSYAIPCSPMKRTRFPNVLVTLISMGENARTYQVERLLHTLRTRGQWDGAVMLLTDAPQYYSELLDADPAKNVYVMTVDTADYWKNFTVSNTLQFKRFKMLQLKYVDRLFPQHNVNNTNNSSSSSIDSVLYVDMDNLIGDPLDDVLGYFMRQRDRSIATTTEANSSYLWLFEQKLSRDESFHGGILFLDRTRSRRCLELWREYTDTNQYGRDQISIMQVHRLHRNECRIVTHAYEPFLQFPTAETMVAGETSVFVHITNTYRAIRIAKETQFEYMTQVYGIDPRILFAQKPLIN